MIKEQNERLKETIEDVNHIITILQSEKCLQSQWIISRLRTIKMHIQFEIAQGIKNE